MQVIRILIVDDNARFRRRIRKFLATEPDIQVVGEAADGREAIEKGIELEPDVVFMDVRMAGMNGFDATRRLAAAMLGLEQSIFAPLKAGGEREGLLVVTGTGLAQADVPAVTAFASQASIALENVRLVEETRTRSTEMEQLPARLFRAQEEERRRISLELLDELGQALTGIGFDLAALEKGLPPEVGPEARERLANLGSLLVEADERVSEMALDLRPQMLDDLGLLPTLRWYVNRYAKRLNIKVGLEAIHLEERLTSEMETVLYRVVQEALTNVARHAQASRVRVRLERSDSMVTATIEDNGKGFDMQAIRPELGTGLLGIQERAALLGGRSDIQSHPGQGTRLSVEIPWRDRS